MKESLRIQVSVHLKNKVEKFQIKIEIVNKEVKVEVEDYLLRILWVL